MNEHIKLLIMKAGGIICSDVATGTIEKIDYLHFDAEKLTMLIVEECIEVFSKDLPDDSGKMLEVVNRVCNVADHFGVDK